VLPRPSGGVRATPEARSETFETVLIPSICPSAAGRFRPPHSIRCLFDQIASIEVFEKGETADDFVIVRLGQFLIEFVFGQVTLDLLSPPAAHYTRMTARLANLF
jgi:hypothetical protein